MTWQDRAAACSVGIIPTTIGGIALMICGCRVVAYTLELATAAAYLLWILIAFIQEMFG